MINTPYKSGEALLRAWHCETREDKLERACITLMALMEQAHVEQEGQSLKENINNPRMFCSCADAYRMGHEALKLHPKKEAS